MDAKRLALLLAWTVLLAVFAAGADPIPAGPPEMLLFSYFKGSGQDGLHLAASKDGLKWTPLKKDKPFLIPAVGNDKLMRNPCIVPGPDGWFHMVWTVSWNEPGIGYARSKDLIEWSPQKYIPVMENEPTARNCWAPEIFHDAANEQYLIFWATTIPGRFPATENSATPGRNHRIYFATTRDFETFGPTKLLYDPGFNVIDSTIVANGSRFVMFLKDETLHPPQKNIRTAFADHPEGPWGPACEPITGNYWAEGPSAIKTGNSWIVYFDKYTQRRYGAVKSSDLLRWEDISNKVEFPNDSRHGTVFRAKAAIVERLRQL